MNDDIFFGNRLHQLRKQNKLTLQQLGSVLGMTKSSVGNLEHGRKKPSLEVVSKLADYFDVPVDYLLGRGLFAHWDAIIANKDHICNFLEDQSDYLKKLDLKNLPEKYLLLLFPALFSEIRISEDNEEITLCPSIPLSFLDTMHTHPPID